MNTLMNVLFFGAIVLYFIGAVLQFIGSSFKKPGLTKLAWIVFLVGFAAHTVYLVVRGAVAHRLPLANQFEFAAAFAWGVALIMIVLNARFHADWIAVAAMPAAFLILSYAALQPREITELMPALKSAWFGFHIGSAAISYSCFILAGAAGLRWLLLARRESADSRKLHQMDYMAYRLIAVGFLLLTVTILTGAIWAEQAWSAFWTWDPKEVWALITWIIYAVYLHLRLRQKRSGKVMAWFAIIAVPVVLFTFVGVNTLMPGLHSYG